MTNRNMTTHDRRSIAEAALHGYDFGQSTTIVGQSAGWEEDIDGGSIRLEKTLFCEHDEHDNEASEKARLVVIFDRETGEVTECYAIDGKGNIFGEPEPGTVTAPMPPADQPSLTA